MTNPFFCWHKWGKWSPPHNGIFVPAASSIGYFHVCQLRECEKCGIASYRKLPKMRSLAELKKEQ